MPIEMKLVITIDAKSRRWCLILSEELLTCIFLLAIKDWFRLRD